MLKRRNGKDLQKTLKVEDSFKLPYLALPPLPCIALPPIACVHGELHVCACVCQTAYELQRTLEAEARPCHFQNLLTVDEVEAYLVHIHCSEIEARPHAELGVVIDRQI